MNPLLTVQFPIPFDQVQPEQVEPAISELLAAARAALDAIAASAEPRTYANTLGALDAATETLDLAVAVTRHLEGVVTTPELRAAWNAVQPAITEFYSSIPLHSGLWSALQLFSTTPEAAALPPVRARYLKKTLDAFRRHGADLAPARKAELAALEVELATATTKFAQNVLDSTAAFELVLDNEAALAGLPPSAVAAARQSAEAKGLPGWRFTLQAPSYVAVLTYLDDRSIRETLWRAYMGRAAAENSALIAQILQLRRRKAQMLGFAHFADLVLVERMAKTGATAQSFVKDLRAKTEAAFHQENQALQLFKDETTGSAEPLQPWDVAYWAEKQRAARFAFDEEDLRPYFHCDRVVSGLFELVERLYGVKVRPAGPVPLWHPEVSYYEIVDEDGTLLGSFYADWFPRDSKRGGAWMDAFYTGNWDQGPWRPHVGLMCGNLTPAVGETPALLTHREVETIFHEFGHLLHHLLSRVEVRGLAGTNVAWDFVELPSQIMENWCWEREALDLFARHYQTGDVIPDALLAKMRAARTYRAANGQMRQLGFATVDLALHIDFSGDTSPLDFGNAILKDFAPAPLPPGYAMLAGFTHLFADSTGYAAGYYSYKWAEVLDADAFTRFQTEGLFNRETGRAFRDCILSQGDSRDAAELFQAFMGRPPAMDALLRRLGLS